MLPPAPISPELSLLNFFPLTHYKIINQSINQSTIATALVCTAL